MLIRAQRGEQSFLTRGLKYFILELGLGGKKKEKKSILQTGQGTCAEAQRQENTSLFRARHVGLSHKETGGVARKEEQVSGDPPHQALCARLELGGVLTRRGG